MKNSKHRTPSIKKTPSLELERAANPLKFWVWNFLGVWGLRLGVLALVFDVSPSALACAACYGASDSALAQGMNWGILTLLGVIGTVLFGITAFFVHVGRKSARMNAGENPETDLKP